MTAPHPGPHDFDAAPTHTAAARNTPGLARHGGPFGRRRRRGVRDTCPTLGVFRHDGARRTLVTLTGEIDLVSAPPLREELQRCLLDGYRTVDVDLRAVTFCDCSGVNAFLAAAHHTASAGGSLRLRYPSAALTRLFALTGTSFLVADDPSARRRTGLPPPATAASDGAP
ncbi:STAS domain-containing protein [Streptomyces sp. B6B3]|uniref:STAS domain-containing protein n=1 Tax=Streptomyces sp. B6B3 TaxID=3153570 RepID=UPI00325E092D